MIQWMHILHNQDAALLLASLLLPKIDVIEH